jgi:hypothetical protein
MSYSTSGLLASLAGGTYDTDVNNLLAYLTSNRAGFKVWLTFDHEFDSKIAKGVYAFSDFYPAFNHFTALVAAHGDSGIIPTTIYTGSSFPARWAAYNPSMTGIGAVGLDPYQTSSGQTAETLISANWAIINGAGFPMIIGEIASRLRAYTLTVPGGVTAFTLEDAVGNITVPLSSASAASDIQTALNTIVPGTPPSSNGANYTVTGAGPFTVSYTDKSQAPFVHTSVGGTATCVPTATVANFVASLSYLQGLASAVAFYNTGANQTSQPGDDDQIDDLPTAIANYGALM